MNINKNYREAMTVLENVCQMTHHPTENFERFNDLLAGMPVLDQVEVWEELRRIPQEELLPILMDGKRIPEWARPGFQRFVGLAVCWP